MSSRSPRSPHLYIIGGTAARVSSAVRDRHERSRSSQIAQERASAWADTLAYPSAYRALNDCTGDIAAHRRAHAGKVKRPSPAAVEAFHAYWTAFLLATHNETLTRDATRLRLRALAAHAAQVTKAEATPPPPRDA